MRYFKKIEGERIYLSPMNPTDVEIYTNWLNNPEITKFLSIHNGLVSLLSEQEYLDNFCKKEFNLAIVKKDSDTLIGNIGLDDIDYKNGTAELGIFIGEIENLGKGYGTEAIKLLTNYAFANLRLHTIILRTYDFNERAQKSYEKCGFKEFGRRHDAIFLNGEYHDIIYMELINNN